VNAQGGTYCAGCGDTRWNVFGNLHEGDLGACEICGGKLIPDRRHPTARFARRQPERRAVTPAKTPAAR
jgi:hypothetical protein